MPLGVVFWIVMLITLIIGLWSGRTADGFDWPRLGNGLITWVLLAILGWAVFGSMVK